MKGQRQTADRLLAIIAESRKENAISIVFSQSQGSLRKVKNQVGGASMRREPFQGNTQMSGV
eukprot:5783997-Pleurochrysis_carterae.AAC.1